MRPYMAWFLVTGAAVLCMRYLNLLLYMGIANLVSKALAHFVDGKTTVDNLSSRGLVTAAVDNSSWWHRALYSVSCEYCEDDRAAVETGICAFYKNRIDMLGRCGLMSLIFVFDGAPLPAKDATKRDRQAVAEMALGKAVIAKSAMPARAGSNDKKAYKRICDAAVQRSEWMEDALCAFLSTYAGDVTVKYVHHPFPLLHLPLSTASTSTSTAPCRVQICGHGMRMRDHTRCKRSRCV